MNQQNATTKPTPQKLYGTYPQKQAGLYMQRISIPGGQLSAPQLKNIADIAQRYTGGTPLHLTTRQSIELHNVLEADAAAVLERLYDAGLPTLGAGGDNVRTVTVCPCCAANPEAYDVAPLAQAVCDFIAARRPQLQLPRKFKITFYGCNQPQSKPFVNCLAFGAISETTVRVIGAGSMGPRPEPGIMLYDELPICDIPALIEAALEMFDKYGNRQNRRQARFRHVRQRIGDAAFKVVLDDFLEQHKNKTAPLVFSLSRGQSGLHNVSLQTIAGELPPHAAQLIAQTAENTAGRIQLNLHHGIDLYTTQPLTMPHELAPMLNRPRIVACPGSATCKNGIVNCAAAAAQLSDALKDNPAAFGKIIALSGCPNNCAQSHIADVGLIGRLKTIDNEHHEAYQVLTGGDNGCSNRLAQAAEIVLAEDLNNKIVEIGSPFN